MFTDLLVRHGITNHNNTHYKYTYIGQFLNAHVIIDTENMLMKLDDRNPISVKKDKAWPYLGVDTECWYGADTDNQGTGIIEGVYTDYIVDHLIPQNI